MVQYYKSRNNESMGRYMSHENHISALSHVRNIVHENPCVSTQENPRISTTSHVRIHVLKCNEQYATYQGNLAHAQTVCTRLFSSSSSEGLRMRLSHRHAHMRAPPPPTHTHTHTHKLTYFGVLTWSQALVAVLTS